MTCFPLTHPVATISRGIENIVLMGDNSENLLVKGSCALTSRLISLTVFPLFLALELVFKRIPKLILAIGNQERFNRKLDKVMKYVLSLLFSPLGLRSPEGISGFFLKSPNTPTRIRPFGVEAEYGKSVGQIFLPQNVRDLQTCVLMAKENKQQISVIGAGMSQGTQTIPQEANAVAIHTKYLNQIELSEDLSTVKVEAGATWEQVQLLLDEHGKSTIVKQASDLFSIGGSIGINCHGWAHEWGAIASTVTELEVMNADGEILTLRPEDELFGCQFGTLGYFGIVVSATFRVVDNEPLVEKMESVNVDDFITRYKTDIQGKNIPLFGGRLSLDAVDGDLLREVCMVRYEKDPAAIAHPGAPILQEAKKGERIERVALKLISNLSYPSTKRLLSWFWSKEKSSLKQERRLTRNEALHPPINAFRMLHHSHLHTQWLQEYFIKPENLPNFLRFLGSELKANEVRLINATIRPTPQDKISILPYAEQERYAVVICFAQRKTKKELAKTEQWIKNVNGFLLQTGDVYYQAYMPYATPKEFEHCYGEERIERLRALKAKHDPEKRFGNAHTAKYFDAPIN